MQSPSQQILTCPICGGALEETSGGGFGCMICLLRAGIGSEEEVSQDSTNEALEGDGHFGVYEIDRREDGSLYELGRGAMGVTYRATDTTLRRKVALKIIKIDVVKRSVESRERFMREARAAAALRHENIATVYQFGIREETGQYFYAMELIEGETLDERVHRTGPLDAPTTIQIGQQVASALAAAEKHGLVHRDLKPANLMLVSSDGETAGADLPAPGAATQRRGRKTTLFAVAASLRSGIHRNPEKLLVKIIDFGLAKALHTETDPQSLTHERFVGTPAFASPEQFEHSALDVRSDIYSLGETLWFALTGKTPYAGRSVEEIHRAQQSSGLPIEQLKAAHVPSSLRSLLESMLALEPASRPGTQELAACLQRCSPEARQLRHKRVALATAALLILGVSAFFIFLSLRTHLGPPDKSIAVLPFENLSPDPNNVYFADGVQDEILTRLASLADLKVINRTSVMQYKSGAARDLRTIGHQLGVARVVEGSVQRAGNRVRVNAQLIDVSTNRALWGQTYDRELADVFAIQSEIATSIAHQLQASLSPREKIAIEQAPTNDIPAFELYARAKDLLASRNAKGSLLEAADLLNQAVTRDPSFFKAYCLLASTHDRIYFFGDDHTPARLALAEAAIQAAFRLRPDAGEAHLARAQNLYRGYLDYDGALAELEIAAKTLPNDAGVFELKGYIQRRQGKQEEAVRSLERAIALDPRNSFTLQQIALSYRHLRRFAEEKSVLDRALAIEPSDLDTKLERAAVDFHSKADPRPLHQTVDSIRATNPGATQDIVDFWLNCALAERDAAAAKNALIAAGENPPSTDEAVTFSRLFMEGVIARMTKDDAGAHAAFTAARAEQQKVIQANESYGPPLCVMGLIDAGLGRKEEALREGRRAVELLPVEKDPINGIAMVKYLAVIAAWVGDKDLACEQLAIAIHPPSRLTYGELKLLPFWDPLRGDPRFEKIVASLAPTQQRQ
jgi:serine/threonine protein kinase/tetratricopeptide (TPR) repeat protein